ncbi:MAG: hypothetical protein KDB63_06905 [Nocardioidaceae bacterium]|nr:hypothetical protein [Nocardioidaceae bacterium]
MGPRERALRDAVGGGSADVVTAAAEEWRSGAQLLANVAMALDLAAEKAPETFGPASQTAADAAAAFGRVKTLVMERSDQMTSGSQALLDAVAAYREAQTTLTSLGAEPTAPVYHDPGPAADDADVIRASVTYNNRVSAYHADLAARESQSAAALTAMDTSYDGSIATLQSIHGEPDPATGSPAGGTSSASGTRAGSGGAGAATSSGTGTGAGSGTGSTGGTGADGTGTGTGGTGTGSGSGSGGPGGSGGSGGGAPQGGTPGGDGGAPGSGGGPIGGPPGGGFPGGGSGGSGGSGGGTVGGVAGTVGGGVIGGLAGLGGAVRGPLPMVPVTGAASGSLGSTTRPASAGTLGRPTTAPGTVVGGGKGASGGRSSTGGGRGARGVTGAMAGGGAGGRGDRRRRDAATAVDHLDGPQDWLDDDDPAPGLLD